MDVQINYFKNIEDLFIKNGFELAKNLEATYKSLGKEKIMKFRENLDNKKLLLSIFFDEMSTFYIEDYKKILKIDFSEDEKMGDDLYEYLKMIDFKILYNEKQGLYLETKIDWIYYRHNEFNLFHTNKKLLEKLSSEIKEVKMYSIFFSGEELSRKIAISFEKWFKQEIEDTESIKNIKSELPNLLIELWSEKNEN